MVCFAHKTLVELSVAPPFAQRRFREALARRSAVRVASRGALHSRVQGHVSCFAAEAALADKESKWRVYFRWLTTALRKLFVLCPLLLRLSALNF